MIAAVVFDFDGLILDTELPVFLSWAKVYRDHGVELDLAHWRTIIGTASFDPGAALETRLGRAIDRVAVDEGRRLHRDGLQASEAVRPGVVAWLDDARRLGLGVGVASSSSSPWVSGHLLRLGLADRVDVVRCRDHVGVAKPDPAVYLAAVAGLGVQPAAALAVEDSVPGVAAAKAAGLWCVAVPSALTEGMDFSAADVVARSLADLSLPDLVRRLGGVTGG